jgi:hypothetical protein
MENSVLSEELQKITQSYAELRAIIARKDEIIRKLKEEIFALRHPPNLLRVLLRKRMESLERHRTECSVCAGNVGHLNDCESYDEIDSSYKGEHGTS